VIDGVGFDKYGPPLSSLHDGSANWLFKPRPEAAYIKWGVLILRSAGAGSYSVSGKVRNEQGDTIAAGRFAGQIPDGETAEDIIYDGVLMVPRDRGAPEVGSSV
jgi:hypothetical protein